MPPPAVVWASRRGGARHRSRVLMRPREKQWQIQLAVGKRVATDWEKSRLLSSCWQQQHAQQLTWWVLRGQSAAACSSAADSVAITGRAQASVGNTDRGDGGDHTVVGRHGDARPLRLRAATPRAALRAAVERRLVRQGEAHRTSRRAQAAYRHDPDGMQARQPRIVPLIFLAAVCC